MKISEEMLQDFMRRATESLIAEVVVSTPAPLLVESARQKRRKRSRRKKARKLRVHSWQAPVVVIYRRRRLAFRSVKV